MASTFEQQYKPNTRTISGLVNAPFQDDVVMECNTSGGAVALTLLDIAANWSTQYKLYIIDASKNAGTNNITVNAPAGFTINGAPSAVINTNGGILIIRIADATNYIAQSSATSGGGGGVTGAANVGTGAGQVFRNLIAGILNFKTIKAGAGVTVTNNADDITIAATAGASQFLYARKNLDTPATTYVAPAPFGTRSVVSGTIMDSFDSKVENGVTGFDLASGLWTVDADGWYSVSCKMIIRINPTSVDSNVDGIGAGWMAAGIPLGQGFIGIALIKETVDILCSNKQFIQENIGDVNIDCSVEAVQLSAGQRVRLNIINQTDHAIKGIAYGLAGQPDCQIQVAIKRVA